MEKAIAFNQLIGKMNLHEILRQLPPDMVFKSHFDGQCATVSEMLSNRDEKNCEVTDLKFGYGKDVRKAIVSDSYVLYSEVKSKLQADGLITKSDVKKKS